LGYKTVIKSKLLFDVYGYLGTYKNFISRRDGVQFVGGVPAPNAPFNAFSLVVNAPGEVKTYGWGASLDYLLPKGFTVGVNASSDVLEDVPDGFRAFFNAPKLRTNVSVGNSGFGKKRLIGFNLVWKWQEGFFYESDFIQGDLPAFHNVDAAINFKAPKIRSLIKIGANNLLNSYYRTAVANPAIGGLYYVSFAYNVL
jgi:outer membrane receptor protein involved in Fe transport